MVALTNGKWSTDPIATNSEKGEFIRADSIFRGRIPPEDVDYGRFQLYVSYACPWAHRTLIVRNLKQLQQIIPVSVTNPVMKEKGWTFGVHHDLEYLADIYRAADPHYTGKVTVPVLWDHQKETIINNESAEIIRILNSGFNSVTSSTIDLYPSHLETEIDEINEKIYHSINNGVYKTGFASQQKEYENACRKLFLTLEELDVRLSNQMFLVGDKITEADIRLFTTLIRFDSVYYVHFKCNLKLIKEFSFLYEYMKSLYQIPAIKETCHFDHIKEHYYCSHPWLNPNKIIPLGPLDNLDLPHRRGKAEFHHFKTQAKLQ
jgi:glutathionyl-hydroquinone reductase